MIKIFCFGSDYPPTGGGISTHTEEWLRALSQEKDIRVRATIFGNKDPRHEKVGGVIELETVSSVGFFFVGLSILKTMWKYRHYHVFHSFNLFPVGFWTVFWAKALRRKSVVTLYGADACDKRTSKKVVWLQWWTIRNASHVVAITQFTQKRVSERYNISPTTIEVIHPVLPKNDKTEEKDIRDKIGITPQDFVVLSVSRLVKRKGIEYLIEAISKIPDPHVKLLIVGGGHEKERLEEFASSLQLTERVVFAGKVPALTPYYEACDVGALVSYYIEEEGDFEGLGLVLLEAQSYGKPVIGSMSGGIPEALLDNVTGILVPERNSEAIAHAVLRFKTDVSFYNSAKKATGDFLKKEFGRDATIGKYLMLISKNF